MKHWAALCCAIALTACSNDTPKDSSPPDKARRIVTLAPHLAELVFAAGAGSTLVGISAYTDYPPEASELPVISDAFTVDQEQLRLLDPDLVLAWSSGMPASTIEDLRSTGLQVEVIETRGLDDIADAVKTIGELTGHEQSASAEAERFAANIATLATEYADRPQVRVFFQVSARPLYTINGQHYISELISVCGGVNVFEDLGELAPAVDVEAVLARRPEAIVSLGPADTLSQWDRFDTLPANEYDNRLLVESDHLGRASTRLDSAGGELCEKIDAARQRIAN